LAQVGIIIAIPVIIGIFTGIMWSSFSDAIGRRKPFLIQSTIVTALFINIFDSKGLAQKLLILHKKISAKALKSI